MSIVFLTGIICPRTCIKLDGYEGGCEGKKGGGYGDGGGIPAPTLPHYQSYNQLAVSLTFVP